MVPLSRTPCGAQAVVLVRGSIQAPFARVLTVVSTLLVLRMVLSSVHLQKKTIASKE